MATYCSYMESYGFRTNSCSNVSCYLRRYRPFITTNYQEARKLASTAKPPVLILNSPIKFIALTVVFIRQSSSIYFKKSRGFE